MKQNTQIEKKAPVLKFLAILAAATSVILVLTITPWNIVPTLVTEDVTVIAVTDYGCVAESVLGHSVVVSECNAKVGDVISATFYVPAMEQNGYYDRIQDKLEVVNP
jgi:predicted RNA-binding protein